MAILVSKENEIALILYSITYPTNPTLQEFMEEQSSYKLNIPKLKVFLSTFPKIVKALFSCREPPK